ncbi:unnamed protein product, partial [Brassica oleracea]
MSRRLKMKEKVMHLNEAGSVIYIHWGRVMIITIRGATSKHEEAEGEIFFFGRSVRLIYDSVSFFVRFLLVHESRFSGSIRKGGGAVVVVEVGELNVSRAIV